eukprot:366028-Chlamydomonas_euryale.AAC.23
MAGPPLHDTSHLDSVASAPAPRTATPGPSSESASRHWCSTALAAPSTSTAPVTHSVTLHDVIARRLPSCRASTPGCVLQPVIVTPLRSPDAPCATSTPCSHTRCTWHARSCRLLPRPITCTPSVEQAAGPPPNAQDVSCARAPPDTCSAAWPPLLCKVTWCASRCVPLPATASTTPGTLLLSWHLASCAQVPDWSSNADHRGAVWLVPKLPVQATCGAGRASQRSCSTAKRVHQQMKQTQTFTTGDAEARTYSSAVSRRTCRANEIEAPWPWRCKMLLWLQRCGLPSAAGASRARFAKASYRAFLHGQLRTHIDLNYSILFVAACMSRVHPLDALPARTHCE